MNRDDLVERIVQLRVECARTYARASMLGSEPAILDRIRDLHTALEDAFGYPQTSSAEAQHRKLEELDQSLRDVHGGLLLKRESPLELPVNPGPLFKLLSTASAHQKDRDAGLAICAADKRDHAELEALVSRRQGKHLEGSDYYRALAEIIASPQPSPEKRIFERITARSFELEQIGERLQDRMDRIWRRKR